MKWLEIYDNAWVVISYPPTVHQSNMSANNCFFSWFSCKSTTHISPYRAIQVLRYWWNFPKSNMIQCASRAHPSVSTTRLAPKHPQRCVGVLLGKNRWVASTYSFHLDKETKKSLHDFACPVWQDGKFGKHAIYMLTCYIQQACGTRLSWWHACRIQKVHFHFHTLKRFKGFKAWHTRPGNLVQATSATTVETKTLAGKSPGLVWKPAFRKHIQ